MSWQESDIEKKTSLTEIYLKSMEFVNRYVRVRYAVCRYQNKGCLVADHSTLDVDTRNM